LLLLLLLLLLAVALILLIPSVPRPRRASELIFPAEILEAAAFGTTEVSFPFSVSAACQKLTNATTRKTGNATHRPRCRV
jgi:hypothetical protein